MFVKTSRDERPGNSASAKVEIPADAERRRVIIATAYGQSSYDSGGSVNAGITVSIECSGTNQVVADDSFEGESSTMTYRASVTQIFPVDAGFAPWVKATVTPVGAGGDNNRDSSVVVTAVAVPE